jgi:hypothetical protein
MPFIIVICSVIYLIFSTPTMQNKSYTFGFSVLSAKNIICLMHLDDV